MRDTDQDWREIANAMPYFGVFSQERFKNPSPADLKEFFATGEADIAYYLETIRRVFGQFQPASALDFGCGVGRVLIPLARLTGKATGVDVANDMLMLAGKHARQAAVSVTLKNAIPADESFDWVNSQIVLQHIPPARGYSIIAALWGAVAANGVLVLHITAFREPRHAPEIERDFSLVRYDGNRVVGYSESDERRTAICMYDYDLSQVFARMPMADGTPVFLEKTDHGGYHGFRIYARKRG